MTRSSTAEREENLKKVEEDEATFTERLYSFMSSRGTPIVRIPIFDKKELNLFRLYREVTARGGVEVVIMNKMWRSVTNELSVDPERTDAGFRLRTHYLKYLYPYERKFFLGLEDDNFDLADFEKMLSKSAQAGGKEKRATRSMPARTKKNSNNSDSAKNGGDSDDGMDVEVSQDPRTPSSNSHSPHSHSHFKNEILNDLDYDLPPIRASYLRDNGDYGYSNHYDESTSPTRNHDPDLSPLHHAFSSTTLRDSSPTQSPSARRNTLAPILNYSPTRNGEACLDLKDPALRESNGTRDQSHNSEDDHSPPLSPPLSCPRPSSPASSLNSPPPSLPSFSSSFSASNNSSSHDTPNTTPPSTTATTTRTTKSHKKQKKPPFKAGTVTFTRTLLTQNIKKLDFTTLRRYKNYHKIKIDTNTVNKDELIEAVSFHFSQQKVDEDRENAIIKAFVAAIRSDDSKRDREYKRKIRKLS